MKTKLTRLAGIIVMIGLGLAFAGAPLAQTTTTVDVRNFEVISVDGNKLVVRDQKGTQEYTVPDDFRFTVNGKKMSVSELKAGMKGTATVTTTTTIKPVVVTEVRKAKVVSASNQSVTVRLEDGNVRKFTQEQLDARGVQIIMDGVPTPLANLHSGDMLTATIITEKPPIVLTEQEVQATLAESKAEPAPAKVAATAPPTPTPAPTPAAGVSPQPSAAQPASPAAAPSGLGSMWYVLIAALVAVVLFVVMRRRKGA